MASKATTSGLAPAELDFARPTGYQNEMNNTKPTTSVSKGGAIEVVLEVSGTPREFKLNETTEATVPRYQ